MVLAANLGTLNVDLNVVAGGERAATTYDLEKAEGDFTVVERLRSRARLVMAVQVTKGAQGRSPNSNALRVYFTRRVWAKIAT